MLDEQEGGGSGLQEASSCRLASEKGTGESTLRRKECAYRILEGDS